jgi:hypothetical protein
VLATSSDAAEDEGSTAFTPATRGAPPSRRSRRTLATRVASGAGGGRGTRARGAAPSWRPRAGDEALLKQGVRGESGAGGVRPGAAAGVACVSGVGGILPLRVCERRLGGCERWPDVIEARVFQNQLSSDVWDPKF